MRSLNGSDIKKISKLGFLTEKVRHELMRLRRRFFNKSGSLDESLSYKLENLPYELFDQFSNQRLSVDIPKVVDARHTVERILADNCSLARFGDGEFRIIYAGSHLCRKVY